MFSRFGFRWRRSTKAYNVVTLDGNTLSYELEGRATGDDLLQLVLGSITVYEQEYFGLVSPEANFLKWVVPNKPLKKQLSGRAPYTLHFRVVTYPKDHNSIRNHNTRHQLFMQIRHDLHCKRLKCNNANLTQLAALAAQAEVGDFDSGSCGANYLSELQSMPRLTGHLAETVTQLHKLNRGKTSLECEREYLETAQEVDSYGAIEYTVQDSHKTTVTLSSGPSGVKVPTGNETNCYEWNSIWKIASKGKHVTLHVTATETRPPHHIQFNCASSQMAQSLVSSLNRSHTFYCSATVPEQSSSRLKRFFSSRRSMRRSKPSSDKSLRHPSTNPTPRRAKGSTSRRASYGYTGIATKFQDVEISIDTVTCPTLDTTTIDNVESDTTNTVPDLAAAMPTQDHAPSDLIPPPLQLQSGRTPDSNHVLPPHTRTATLTVVPVELEEHHQASHGDSRDTRENKHRKISNSSVQYQNEEQGDAPKHVRSFSTPEVTLASSPQHQDGHRRKHYKTHDAHSMVISDSRMANGHSPAQNEWYHNDLQDNSENIKVLSPPHSSPKRQRSFPPDGQSRADRRRDRHTPPNGQSRADRRRDRHSPPNGQSRADRRRDRHTPPNGQSRADRRRDRHLPPNGQSRADRRRDRYSPPNGDSMRDQYLPPNVHSRRDRYSPPNGDSRKDRYSPPNGDSRRDRYSPPNGDSRRDRYSPPNGDSRKDRYSPPNGDSRKDRYSPPNGHSMGGRQLLSEGYYQRDRHSSPKQRHEIMPPLEENANQAQIDQRQSKSKSLPRSPLSQLDSPALGSMDGVVKFLDRSFGTGSKMEKWRQYASKPRNRPRLSLQDAKYYDAARKTGSFGGLAQANEGAGRLGSITSLGQQMSFAELSQTDDLDPHLRSFVFESSQTEDTGTEL